MDNIEEKYSKIYNNAIINILWNSDDAVKKENLLKTVLENIKMRDDNYSILKHVKIDDNNNFIEFGNYIKTGYFAKGHIIYNNVKYVILLDSCLTIDNESTKM